MKCEWKYRFVYIAWLIIPWINEPLTFIDIPFNIFEDDLDPWNILIDERYIELHSIIGINSSELKIAFFVLI